MIYKIQPIICANYKHHLQIKGILISKRHWSVYFYLFSHRMTKIDDKKTKKRKRKKEELELPDDVITENKTNEINKNLIKTGEIKKRHFFVYQAIDV